MQKGNGHGDSGKDLRAVLIIWRDSHCLGGWRDVDDESHKIAPIVSVGLVHKEDDSAITLSTSIGGWGGAVAPITIPKEAICFMRRVPLPHHSTKRWRTKPARE